MTPPLKPEHIAYLQQFAASRRMMRNPLVAIDMDDPLRIAVGLPIGIDGGFYVGTADKYASQVEDPSVIGGSTPPDGQPGLWCQWEPSPDGTTIRWDEGEKFYEYVPWMHYLLEKFLIPWGYWVGGMVEWEGEESDDRGAIRIIDNVLETSYAEVLYRWPSGSLAAK